MEIDESGNCGTEFVKKKYQDLTLDLNLDTATAKEAWSDYLRIQQSYTLEGDQLPWLACALYAACRKKSVPTVDGKPGHVIQGNCVSLTRMLQHCTLPLTEFIRKMKSWLAMSHCDEDFCRKIDLLERNFAVSSNIFKEYKPIFLDLFQDPSKDPPRPLRSRKQRRPPCNATELFNFCWTLYIFIKGRYPSIPQDLVSCYSLLLACVDLMFSNVLLSNRKELLNPCCPGLPDGFFESDQTLDLSSWPVSIMDYLCKKFEGVVVDTKVVRDYYWKSNIEDLVKKGVLKGSTEGMGLIEQSNFDHNVKEVKNAYEEYLLSCGEFDERMFISEASVIQGTLPMVATSSSFSSSSSSTAFSISSTGIRSVKCNLSQTFEGDHHLVPQTPISIRKYTLNKPKIGSTPLTVITNGLQKLYTLMAGRKNELGEELIKIFSCLSTDPGEKIASLISEMSDNFTRLYSQATEDYTAPSIEFTNRKLQMGQILFYTFLEHILLDEKKRHIDIEAILKEELFHKTLFTCCLEIVLKSYNDARRFPWSLQVGAVDPYYFMRIIEPVIRSEQQSENQLSRELVKHLKGIEEQILDSLAWRSESPLWQIIKNSGADIPSCEDVNFSHQLETTNGNDTSTASSTIPSLQSSTIMSPAVKVQRDLSQSPLSSTGGRLNSPINQGSIARRMLFPVTTSSGTTRIGDVLKTVQPPGIPLAAVPKTLNLNIRINNQEKKNEIAGGVNVDSFLQNSVPLSVASSVITSSDSTPSSSSKPRRHGSLALFFRKFYTLANMRLRDLCDRLDIPSNEMRQKIWTCFEYSIIHYSHLMMDRNMDQLVMCAIYITCRVTGFDRIFQEIMKHYRNQPQAASHVYRSVLISRTPPSSGKTTTAQQSDQSATDNKGNNEGICNPPSNSACVRGDLINFYNTVYVHLMSSFALKFRPAQEEGPRLSPLPINRVTPVSPRRRISTNHSVFVNSLSSYSPPLKCSVPPLSPKRPLPYYFNRSPAKDLRAINNMVKLQWSNGKKKVSVDAENELGTLKKCRLEDPPTTITSFGGIIQDEPLDHLSTVSTSFPLSESRSNV